MASRDMSLALKLIADSSRFVQGLVSGERGVKHFGSVAKREFDALRGAMNSVQGQMARFGVAFGGVALMAQSARMDKSLGQIGQTADVSKGKVDGLRADLFRMASETGQQVDALQASFNSAVQSGLAFREALPVVESTNVAMAVTGAAADRLTSSLTVAGTAFNFNLAKPGQALLLLDKMTVAGRLGNAELENLSDIFARVGVNAAAGGLGFDQTLAFIEGLSMVERQPERLATLADSTLRLFTNLNYMKAAATATNVRFFEKNGSRRDPLAVLRDIKKEYDKIDTEKGRAIFMQKAFGKADLDTIKGLRTLFNGDMLDKINGFGADIAKAGGTLQRDLPDAISNAVDQTGRLKAELRKAADDFARPINSTLSQLIKWGLDKKENGGLGLDGKDVALGGAAMTAGTLALARYGGKGVSALMSRFGGTAAGLAEGKALEAAAGVTPVFVVNMPGGGILGGAGAALEAGAGTTAAKSLGLGGLLRTGGLAAAPLLAMWGVSEWAGDTSRDKERVTGIKENASAPLEKLLSFLGLNFQDRFDAQLKKNREGLDTSAEVKGEIAIKVSQDGAVTSVRATSQTRGVGLNVDAGPMMAGS